MADTPGPGLERQAGVRNAARAVAIVLLLLGGYLLVTGIAAFADELESTSVDGGGFGTILRIGLGGFCVVFGLAAANVGWLGAGARYVAGETVPVVKDSLGHLRGEGEPGRNAAGPYCRSCGTRNDETARFCDGCGQSLA